MEQVLDTFETVFVWQTKWEYFHEFWVPFNILTSSFCTFSAILITMEQLFGEAISCDSGEEVGFVFTYFIGESIYFSEWFTALYYLLITLIMIDSYM